jgi:hypothetical protein
MHDWYNCDHKWRAEIDSQAHNESQTAVYCMKCGCPGDQENKTGDVFWPAT